MARLEQLAAAALACDALALRGLAQDWLAENPVLGDCPAPNVRDPEVLTVAAALVELFAERTGQAPPDWTARVGSLPRPRFLLQAAETMKRLRRMCRDESPAPLRRRNLFAPEDFLRFA